MQPLLSKWDLHNKVWPITLIFRMNISGFLYASYLVLLMNRINIENLSNGNQILALLIETHGDTRHWKAAQVRKPRMYALRTYFYTTPWQIFQLMVSAALFIYAIQFLPWHFSDCNCDMFDRHKWYQIFSLPTFFSLNLSSLPTVFAFISLLGR